MIRLTATLLSSDGVAVVMVESWTEKYRPKKLDEVEGNPKAVETLRSWAEMWESRRFRKGDKKAVILHGGPGTGKTSSALALANEFRWGVVELNASDTRNAAAIRKIATTGALTDTFTSEGDYLKGTEGGEKLIILDEADNIFGREDAGGLQAIVDTIERTQQPIVLIANDFYELSRRSGRLKDLCLTIRFYQLKPETVRAVLRRIAAAEGVRADPEVIDHIAYHSEGDLRSAVNDLQSICDGRTELTIDDLKSVGERDIKKTIFDAINDVFKTQNAQSALEAVKNVDEQPDFILLWLDENLPLAYRDPVDLMRGFEALALADTFIGRVNRKKQFGLWKYAKDIMAVGVALAKKRSSSAGSGYQFPSWLRKMSQQRGLRATRDSLHMKIGVHCHTSKSVARNDILPFFRPIFKNVREFRLGMIEAMELEDSEVAMLLEEPVDSSTVRSAMQEALQGDVAASDSKSDSVDETGVKKKSRGKSQKGKKDQDEEKGLMEFHEPQQRQKSLF